MQPMAGALCSLCQQVATAMTPLLTWLAGMLCSPHAVEEWHMHSRGRCWSGRPAMSMLNTEHSETHGLHSAGLSKCCSSSEHQWA